MKKSFNLLRTIKIEITDLLDVKDKLSIIKTIEDSQRVFDLFVKLGNLYKSTSYQTLHKHGYDDAKLLSPDLPTAILQQIAKNALSSLKSWNSNVLRINQKRKRYNSKTVKYNLNRNIKPLVSKWEYSGDRHKGSYPINKLSLSRRGNLTTFSSCDRRIKILHDIPEWFKSKYPDAILQAGNIIYNSGKYYLNLVYKIKLINNQTDNKIIGIDRGINTVIALSDGMIDLSDDILKIKSRYLYNRSRYQQKGTRSAKRKLKKLAGKEKRFMSDINHCLTKRLSNDVTVGIYVLEDLTGIREAEKKSKEFNRLLSNWSFFQFAFLLEYKCMSNGIEVKYVDPRYTSQKCNVCNNINPRSRNRDKFTCVSCNHTDHADINAAKNIKDNYILGRFQPSNRNGLTKSVTIPSPCGLGS